MGRMPRTADDICIPLPEEDAIRAFLKLKPTPDMPRPGPNPTKPKRRAKKQS